MYTSKACGICCEKPTNTTIRKWKGVECSIGSNSEFLPFLLHFPKVSNVNTFKVLSDMIGPSPPPPGHGRTRVFFGQV